MSIRYELYSVRCTKCPTKNPPDRRTCRACGAPAVPWRRCPGCQTENPPNAFVCVHCYRMLQSRPATGVLNYRVPGTVAFLVIFVFSGWVGYGILKRWVEAAEIQLTTSVRSDQFLALQRMEVQRRASLKNTENSRNPS